MDLIKQYIVQSIIAASNNLRLSTEKIEVVALLRETIAKSDNLDDDIKKMKKITELSTLAIRLSEIFAYLNQPQVDMLKLTDKFKEHAQYLIKDLSHMLDMVSPLTFKKALDKLNPPPPEIEEDFNTEIHAPSSEISNEVNSETEETDGINDSINVNLSKRKIDEDVFEKSESDKIKEKLIMEEEKEDDDLFFQNYENAILKPIKPLDTLLKDLQKNEIDNEKIINFAKVMKTNGDMSAKIGFDIIANMHKIIAKALILINSRELMPGKEIIESMRSCLIVIVAVVKGKEVDITNYLNRAEEFGRKLKNIKLRNIS